MRQSSDVMVFDRASDRQFTRDDGIVRKAGSRVCVEEGTAVQFAHSLQLSVPVVHKVETSCEGTEIVMDVVDGDCLEDVWPPVSRKVKENVARQLRGTLTTMRQAQQSDRPTLLGASNGLVRECRLLSDHVGGRCESEAEFNRDLVLDLVQTTPSSLRRALAESPGDFNFSNIMVQGDHVQAILDREYAGWYPEYWGYVKFFDSRTACRDWKDFAEFVFETEYPKYLITHQAILRWQRNPLSLSLLNDSSTQIRQLRTRSRLRMGISAAAVQCGHSLQQQPELVVTGRACSNSQIANIDRLRPILASQGSGLTRTRKSVLHEAQHFTPATSASDRRSEARARCGGNAGGRVGLQRG
nr:hypothetical protein CFP56_71315 [Quercus suber]